MHSDSRILKYIQNIERLLGNVQALDRRVSSHLLQLSRKIENNQKADPQEITDLIQKIKGFSDMNRGYGNRAIKNLSVVEDHVSSRRDAERRSENHRPIKDYMGEIIIKLLKENGITSGKIGEIGGPQNSFLKSQLPDFDYTFLSLFPVKGDDSVVQADITNCPHVPDESYDMIISLSVFEHVDRPWLGAKEIIRLLKPGGITFHAAPFSYFYHEAPIDYWRFSPSGFEFLFEELECLLTEFYSGNRRRNNVGSEANPIERDGGKQFAVDAFGGWRENWFSFYAGLKMQS